MVPAFDKVVFSCPELSQANRPAAYPVRLPHHQSAVPEIIKTRDLLISGFCLMALSLIRPTKQIHASMDFGLPEGGKEVHPQEQRLLCDWGSTHRSQHRQVERRLKLAGYRDTLHIGHITAQFLTNLLDSVAFAESLRSHPSQPRVIYRAFGNCCAQVAGLQGGQNSFQQRYASVREQVVTIFSGIEITTFISYRRLQGIWQLAQ